MPIKQKIKYCPSNKILKTFFNIDNDRTDIKYTIYYNGKRVGFILPVSVETLTDEKIIDIEKTNQCFCTNNNNSSWLFSVMKKLLSFTDFGDEVWFMSEIEVIQAFNGIYRDFKINIEKDHNDVYYIISSDIITTGYNLINK